MTNARERVPILKYSLTTKSRQSVNATRRSLTARHEDGVVGEEDGAMVLKGERVQHIGIIYASTTVLKRGYRTMYRYTLFNLKYHRVQYF